MVRENKRFNLAEIMRTHPLVAGEEDSRPKPELALALGSPNADMRWFMAFIGVEMKSKRSRLGGR